MSLWEVASDMEAFQRIQDRLEAGVGSIVPLGSAAGPSVVWATFRALFPIAESVADLIYRQSSTAKMLTHLLRNAFEAVRSGYKDKAATLTLIFRHSLTHQDLLRTVCSGKRKVTWILSTYGDWRHLSVGPGEEPDSLVIVFDLTMFYRDLVAVCNNAKGKEWGGEVMSRYNGWLALDLDAKADKTSTEKEAANEIKAMQHST